MEAHEASAKHHQPTKLPSLLWFLILVKLRRQSSESFLSSVRSVSSSVSHLLAGGEQNLQTVIVSLLTCLKIRGHELPASASSLISTKTFQLPPSLQRSCDLTGIWCSSAKPSLICSREQNSEFPLLIRHFYVFKYSQTMWSWGKHNPRYTPMFI